MRILRAAEGARPMLMGFASARTPAPASRRSSAPASSRWRSSIMDRPAIQVCEAFAHAGYPLDVEALLIVEVEGSEAEIADLIGRIKPSPSGSTRRPCACPSRRRRAPPIWKGRKAAFGAMGRIADYLCMDGVIPTGRLPEVLTAGRRDLRRLRPAVANIFHAGDGNLHPLILFNANDPGELAKAEHARRRHPEALRRGRRLPDRRARRRRREARPDAACSSPRSISSADARQGRLRPAVAAESRQGLSPGCDERAEGSMTLARQRTARSDGPCDYERSVSPEPPCPPRLGSGQSDRPTIHRIVVFSVRGGWSRLPAMGKRRELRARQQRGIGRGGARRCRAPRGVGDHRRRDAGDRTGHGRARRWRGGASGITLYEPGALTLVARAGTPLAEVEAALAAEGQSASVQAMGRAGADRGERRADGGGDGGGERLAAYS